MNAHDENCNHIRLRKAFILLYTVQKTILQPFTMCQGTRLTSGVRCQYKYMCICSLFVSFCISSASLHVACSHIFCCIALPYSRTFRLGFMSRCIIHWYYSITESFKALCWIVESLLLADETSDNIFSNKMKKKQSNEMLFIFLFFQRQSLFIYAYENEWLFVRLFLCMYKYICIFICPLCLNIRQVLSTIRIFNSNLWSIRI